MVSIKKLLISITLIVLLIAIGVFFYWKIQQKELINLNKVLPEGIKIIKTLMGNYEITNKIDNYSFKTPKSWEGIKNIYYGPKETIQGYTTSIIEIEGKIGHGFRYVAISQFKNQPQDINLKDWATTTFNDFDLSNDFKNYKVGNIDTVVTRENPDLMNMDIYFLKGSSAIYSIMSGYENFIEEIISNGKW